MIKIQFEQKYEGTHPLGDVRKLTFVGWTVGGCSRAGDAASVGLFIGSSPGDDFVAAGASVGYFVGLWEGRSCCCCAPPPRTGSDATIAPTPSSPAPNAPSEPSASSATLAVSAPSTSATPATSAGLANPVGLDAVGGGGPPSSHQMRSLTPGRSASDISSTVPREKKALFPFPKHPFVEYVLMPS